ARAMMSVPPPGAIGTTSSIDRLGQLVGCACTQVAASNDAPRRARPSFDFRLTRDMLVFMSFSLLDKSVINVLRLLDGRHGPTHFTKRPRRAPHLPVGKPGQLGRNNAATVCQKNFRYDGSQRSLTMLLSLHHQSILLLQFTTFR